MKDERNFSSNAKENNGMTETKAIRAKTDNWDEGLPLGNGFMGSIVYGGNPLKITVDRTDLWDLRPNETTLESGFSYKNMIRLVKSGRDEDWREYRRLFDAIFMEKPYPSKITAGRIEFEFEGCGDIDYSLDMRTATVSVNDGAERIVEVFTDYVTLVGVVRVHRECSYKLNIPDYLSGTEGTCEGDSLSSRVTFGYPPAVVRERDGFLWYEQKTHTDYGFGIVTCRKGNEIYYTLATTDDDGDYIGYAKKRLERAAEAGYEKLHAEHTESWRAYRRRSGVKTGDRLIDGTYEKCWYLFRSCSRKGFYPMPLQGVWTADNGSLPPWKGDYHYDTNTELSYQAYLKANRIDEGEVFVEYLWRMKPEFEKFAKTFFGTDGIIVPACSTLDGKPMGGWPQYSLSPTMTVWAAQSFDEYYLYTGDIEFLRTRAYPFFRGVGKAISGIMEEKDGRLFLPLSSSPEIFDDTRRSYLQPNSNFDLALIRYLFGTLAGYAEILGESAEQYELILSKLDGIAVDGDGVVMLDRTQRLNETHRHFSHLMCMYPLHLINYDTDEHRQIYEQTISDLERLGTGLWTGFSFAMSAQIYAMAKHGNAAYERLRQFCVGFVGENGFHLNGDFRHYGYTQFHYRPFTLEGLFGFCDALHEMLLQDHTGSIELFPAIPEEWRNRTVSFEKLRSRGGLTVSAKARNSEITALSITSPEPREIVVNGRAYCLKKGENVLI